MEQIELIHNTFGDISHELDLFTLKIGVKCEVEVDASCEVVRGKNDKLSDKKLLQRSSKIIFLTKKQQKTAVEAEQN